jgi:hypothetical protein
MGITIPMPFRLVQIPLLRAIQTIGLVTVSAVFQVLVLAVVVLMVVIHDFSKV